MLSKPLVTAALIFQIIGLIWDLYHHLTDSGGIGEFFAAAHWPIFLGFVVLLIAVAQAYQKPKEPNQDKSV